MGKKRDGQARVGSQFLIFQAIADGFPRARWCRFTAAWFDLAPMDFINSKNPRFVQCWTNERTVVCEDDNARSCGRYRPAENRGISLLFATASRGSGLSLPLRNVSLSLSVTSLAPGALSLARLLVRDDAVTRRCCSQLCTAIINTAANVPGNAVS